MIDLLASTMNKLAPVSPALNPTEAELARARADLQASLDALERRLRELRDWRSWIRRRPLPFAVAAFVAGLMVGLRRS